MKLYTFAFRMVRNGFELKLSFFAKITEEKRVRLMVNRWIEQERFGNLTLADGNISRETNPILSIQVCNYLRPFFFIQSFIYFFLRLSYPTFKTSSSLCHYLYEYKNEGITLIDIFFLSRDIFPRFSFEFP